MAKMSFIIYFLKRVQYLLSGHHAQHDKCTNACVQKCFEKFKNVTVPTLPLILFFRLDRDRKIFFRNQQLVSEHGYCVFVHMIVGIVA